MAEHGGTNLDNMYHCVCAVDKIASLMNFQDYSESLTFTYMYDTPGDKGGEFRDPPQSKILRDKLKDAKKQAEVAPLVRKELLGPIADPSFNPTFTIESIDVVLHPLEMVSIPVSQLGSRVGSLSEAGDQIIRAIDQLLRRV